MPIEEGKAAPDFTLRNQDGKRISLKDLRGKHVIVYFYPMDDTPGCTKEALGFRHLWREIKKQDAVILGISPDLGSSHKKFIQKYNLPFPLLSDPDKKVMAEYGAFGETMVHGRKTVGVIRSTAWVDPEGRVKKHWGSVAKAAEHPTEVLEALRREGGE